MKKFIGFLVVVLVVVGVYFAFFKNKSAVQNQNNPVSDTNVATTNANAPAPKADAKILERLRSVSVTASEDGGSVTLSGGEGQFAIDGATKKGSVSIGGVAAEAVSGSRKDLISYITVNPGNGQYLVLFEDKGSSLSQKSLVFLGNNITVQSIVTTPLASSGGPEYVISVKGLERGFETTFIYTVVDGQIDVAKALKL